MWFKITIHIANLVHTLTAEQYTSHPKLPAVKLPDDLTPPASGVDAIFDNDLPGDQRGHGPVANKRLHFPRNEIDNARPRMQYQQVSRIKIFTLVLIPPHNDEISLRLQFVR